jgi:phospho-N-acetylmuramoyl-pentapeptide-transferase
MHGCYALFLMFYHLSHIFPNYAFCNLFRYITLRSVGALFTSFLIVWAATPPFIQWIRSKGVQPVRLDGPESHLLTKKNTATMGGALIMLAYGSTLALWVDWKNPYVWIASGVFTGCGILGAWDDVLKMVHLSPKGLAGRWKLAGQLFVALCGIAALMQIAPNPLSHSLFFPFFKNAVWQMGPWLFALFGVWVVVGGSNAVNLTDGLDGLAIGPVIISCFVFALLSYVAGHHEFAHYLHVPFVPSSGELCVLCASLIGAGLGFLWYNCPPAMIIMGDMGSLALGGFLAIVSLIIKQEFLLAIVGGVFVAETVSVIVQVMVFKKTGRRFFLMAPIHHHFEKKGWSETTVVFRFWIISLLLGIFALSSLKIR